MTTKSVDFTSAIHALMEVYARYVRIYHSKKWRSVHPIASSSGQAHLLSLYSSRWLPAPELSTIASIVDLVEQHSSDPRISRGVAAVLQRAAAVDHSLRSDVTELATRLLDVDVTEHAESALRAHRELETLLSFPEDWRPLECVLGDDHCRPELLLRLARLRLARNEAPWCAVLAVIHRLRIDASSQISGDPNISVAEERKWRREQARLDGEALSSWIEVVGLSIDEVLIVTQWLQRLSEEKSGERQCFDEHQLTGGSDDLRGGKG